MIKSVLEVLIYITQRVLFVAGMFGIPTLIIMFNISLKEKTITKRKLSKEKMAIYVYSIIMTGIVLAIILRKVGL